MTEFSLANLGFVPQFEDRRPQDRPVQQTFLDRLAQGAATSLATLPRRALEASQHYLDTGDYDAAPVLEAAAAATTGGLPFALRGALGSAGGRRGRPPLPMDTASRMSRADAVGFQRDMPLEFGTAPAGERVAAASIKIGDRVFTGPTHADAIMKAEKELGVPFASLMERAGNAAGDITDGFVTTAGRLVSRWEAADIARREGQGDARGRFANVRGAAAENVRLDPKATPRSRNHIGATAPGLPGGQGLWGRLMSPEEAASGRAAPSGHRTAKSQDVSVQAPPIWHRASNPGRMDARGRADHEIQASLAHAFASGYDSVMITNFIRPGGKAPETGIVVRDPSQLRSPKAAFDPARKNSDDLLAGVAGVAAAGTAAGLPLGEILPGTAEEQQPVY